MEYKVAGKGRYEIRDFDSVKGVAVEILGGGLHVTIPGHDRFPTGVMTSLAESLAYVAGWWDAHQYATNCEACTDQLEIKAASAGAYGSIRDGGSLSLAFDGDGPEGVTVSLSLPLAAKLAEEMAEEISAARAAIVADYDRTLADHKPKAVREIERAPEAETSERRTLPEYVRRELFAGLADDSAKLADITRGGRGVKFTARIGEWNAYGAVMPGDVCLVAVERVSDEFGIAEPFELIEHVHATPQESKDIRTSVRWMDILNPRWAEFGVIGNGRGKVHVREKGSSWTLCGRGMAAGWLGRDWNSPGRCVRCNREMDKRTAE